MDGDGLIESHQLLLGGALGSGDTVKVYEYQTWGYLLSDWIEGDDYGVVWLDPQGT